MKKNKGFSVVGLIVGIIIAVGLIIATGLIIKANNEATNYNDYDFYSIIEGTKDNGWISDHVKGDKDAPVLIFEYADYQCPGCASVNPKINKVIEELDGKLAVVYRNFLLSYHQNGTAAASAAEAAGLQGYWKPYADKLFSEQTEWEYASPSERTAYFTKYFNEVTGGKGDVDRFNADIASKEVSKKIDFDMGIAKRIDISATPAFYIDGQWISWSEPGSIDIDGKTFSWDKAKSSDEAMQLIKDIVKEKLKNK